MANNYTIIKPATREEWLALRGQGIGSSEIGTILGLNPFETAYQLWRRKKGLTAPKEENFAMKAGHYLEDAVSKFYADETGATIIKASAGDWIIRNNDRPYMQVSPDRTFWREGDTHNNANKGILECKTTQRQIDADDLPKHWYVQLMYQLGVAELDHGALAWLTAGREFGYRPVDFDADLYAYITERVDEFWTRNILGGEEPPCGSVEDVLTKFSRHQDGKSIVVRDEVAEEIAALKALKAQKADNDKAIEILEETIKLIMEDAEALVDIHGDTLVTWKAAKDSLRFDSKRFAAEQPALYQQYCVSVPGSRRFILK